MIGRRVGCHEIFHRLGEGGVGQVFAAIDRRLDRPVAVKALRPEHSRDAGFLARFQAEAGALAALHHPAIGGIYSLEQEGDQLFMILELVRGATLEAVLADAGALDETACLAVAAQALAGLGAAHAAGVVHRDIKPANLMITPLGALKLMDFGIARVRGSGRMTRHGHLVGTLAYMSPEQIRGEDGTAQSDLYSLGITLYEALTGGPPFQADTEYELLKAQVELPPPPLRERLPQLSPRVADSVMRCLEKDPARRFEDAESLAFQLGVQDLPATPEAILRARLGPAIAGSVAPLTRLIQAARARPERSAPSPRAGFAATRFAPLPGAPSGPPHEEVPPAAARGAAWRPRAAIAAALLLVLGLVGAMLTREWTAPPGVRRTADQGAATTPPEPVATLPAALQVPAPAWPPPEPIIAAPALAPPAAPTVPEVPLPPWPPPEPVLPAPAPAPTVAPSPVEAAVVGPGAFEAAPPWLGAPASAMFPPGTLAPPTLAPATAPVIGPPATSATPTAAEGPTGARVPGAAGGREAARSTRGSQGSGWRFND